MWWVGDQLSSGVQHLRFFCIQMVYTLSLWNVKYKTETQILVQWWFLNPGSDSLEISLIRTKSAGTDFVFWTDGRFSNPENSLIRKYRPGTNVSGLTNHHCTCIWHFGDCKWIQLNNNSTPFNAPGLNDRGHIVFVCCQL